MRVGVTAGQTTRLCNRTVLYKKANDWWEWRARSYFDSRFNKQIFIGVSCMSHAKVIIALLFIWNEKEVERTQKRVNYDD